MPRKPAAVVGVRLERPVITRTLGIIRRSGRSLSPAAEALIRLLTQAGRATVKQTRRH